MSASEPGFVFDNTFVRDMDGFFVPWQGAEVPEPKVLYLNHALAAELKLNSEALLTENGARLLSGVRNPAGAEPLAMAYAGHQFGGFAPQLGDGRAMLIGEVIDRNANRRDIHLKGSGRTPFSRGGDGKAPLGPVLREYLIGEAMYALGVPTTRALAATTTGENVRRNQFEPGAVLARVAASHIRVGTFQFFAARDEKDRVKQLADYVIERHYPDIAADDNPYLELFRQVRDRQARLIAQWMRVGFVHGVMNTDNTTVSGETIDYGPCAFMDHYDRKAVYSSIDHGGRYAYGNQPVIGQWNLARFAECLLDLINPDNNDDAVKLATRELEIYTERYDAYWLQGMIAKLGLERAVDGDLALVEDLLELMQAHTIDFTELFRALSDVVRGYPAAARGMFENAMEFDQWLERYQRRCNDQGLSSRTQAARMDAVNPIYIPRNHLVEAALSSAVEGDATPFDSLLDAVTNPYDERKGLDRFAAPPPAGSRPITTFCGT